MFRELPIVALGVLLTAAVAVAASGCLEPREQPPARHTSGCTTCHGTPLRDAEPLVQSAPPFDVAGHNDTRAPAVGAHLVHLLANDLHAAIACDTCHVVPEDTDSPGHADTALPAEVTFTGLAQANDRAPRYDAAVQRCSDTYCHLAASPSWVPSDEPEERCARCHAMPPAPPHPASAECHLCHGDVVNEARAIIAPERHVDGNIDVMDRCDSCHDDPDTIDDGAHRAHLDGGVATKPVPCEGCHVVPEAVGDPGHLDDSPGAEIIFTGVASSHGRMPLWDRPSERCSDSWCHGPSAPGSSTPVWSESITLSCTGCHGEPPAWPHPQMLECSRCHGEVIDASGSIDRSRHVDGVVDVLLPFDCQACHDVATDPSHAAHLLGSGQARPVLCIECHQVPGDVLAFGHIDTLPPAELTFSGVARAFGASPSFDGTSCADSYCHGDSFVFDHASGGLHTQPIWALVDGSQTTCTGCHGLPPPPPHPPGPLFCNQCHPNSGPLLDFIDPSTHVNGIVEVNLN